MRNLIKTICLLHILITTISSADAQTLTTQQADRLFKTGQLWGHIKYFHPYLQYKTIPFDSAYAAAVPKFIDAQTNGDFLNALNEWLSVLNDPITNAESSAKQVEKPFQATYRTQNKVGIFTLSGDVTDWQTVLAKMESVMDSVENANALILDCRGLNQDMGWLLEYSGLQNKLFKSSITGLGQYSVAHSGFVPEIGSSSGGYQTYFKTFAPTTLTGRAQKDLPTVFIASTKTAIPNVIWAMQKAGKAAIISDDVLSDKNNGIAYELTEGVQVNMRLNETLTGSTAANWVINKGKTEDLVQKAMEIIEKNAFVPQKATVNMSVDLVEKKPNYPQGRYPSLGYRALSVAKVYSVINYFFPNKKFMSGDWDSIVKLHIAPIVMAKDSAEYQLAVNVLYAHIQDGHGYIGGSGAMLNKILMGGADRTAVTGEVVEGQYIITKIISDSISKLKGIEKGDIILKRDGKNIADWVNKIKKHKAHSNDVTGTNYASYSICLGAEDTEGVFTIQKKDGTVKDVRLPFSKKLTKANANMSSSRANEAVLRFLTPSIGYADLDRLESSAVDSMFEMFKNTKAIVFDMRGYPQGTAWTIAPRLTNKKNVGAAKFTRLELDYPKIVSEGNDLGGTETWTTFIQNIPNPSADKKTYLGKTVMLINAETQSQAEHTGLFFRAANGTQFIGSQTAGANGDVTNFTIPGNLTLSFSGQTVWFPNGKQLQRTGLEPDIEVRPTIKGLQAGKDEVLERAVKYLEIGK